MTENVQCPVCTLYLHAGMNLSDHLETHPKEQVIKALVQMTISGVGFGSTNALASVLAGGDNSNETKKSTTTTLELEEKHNVTNDKNTDLINIASTSNSCSATISNSASNCSLSNQSTTSSQNSTTNVVTSFNATTKIEENKQTLSSSPEKQDKKIFSSAAAITASSPLKTTVKLEHQNATQHSKDKLFNENINEGFAKQGFSKSLPTNAANHAYHAGSPIELTNSNNNNHHINFALFGNQRYDQQQQHRSGISNTKQLHAPPHMPPPPPPQPTPAQQTTQHHHGQHQEIPRTVLPSHSTHQPINTGSSGSTFHHIQQQLPPPPPPPQPPSSHHSSSHLTNVSNNHRHPHMFSGQHQPLQTSHHPQGLKVIYTPTLPPPPPLQLFTYQPPTHLQHHQKPPPAYGTAISQIRSQHNQNKHQVTGSLATPHQQSALQTHVALQQQQQQQHPQQQQHLQQQQTLHHNLRIHVPPPPPPIPTKHLFAPKTNELATTSSTARHNHNHHHPQQQQQQHSNKSLTDLSQQHANSEVVQTQNSNYHGLNSNEISSNKTTKITAAVAATTSHNSNAPSYPQVSISPSVASASMAAVAASTLGRHTNSPFAALLAAAAGAPSPSNSSSVLRYAESPVAHYLERDNGDFIVQETPKHIVECVEKDNGEFSVIERIYQSPPSVLHIHDDNDDDDDDEEDEDDDDKMHQDNDENKVRDDNISENEMKHESKDTDIINKSKNENPTSGKAGHKMSTIETKKSNKNNNIASSDNEDDIVDFVSISSDSEEEFISHKRKDHKNTTEKTKKIETPPAATLTTSSSPLISSASSSASASTLITNSDYHHVTATPSSSSSAASSTVNTQQSTTHQSTTSSGGGSRKKSSKNTVTVLSDVQLNLNEYLDLVGNIIASSKVAAQRKTFATLAPIPMVKIEKEEPMDDYAAAATTMVTSDATCSTFEIPPPPLKANKHETDEIETENPPSSSSKHINNHNISLIKELHQQHQLQQQQLQQQQDAEDDEERDEKKPQVLENLHGQLLESTTYISNSTSTTTTTINSSHVTSVIRMATTSQQQQQPHSQLNKSENSIEAEDLSQPQRKIQTSPSLKSNVNITNQPLVVRKGPKKLVIKPKSSKTEVLSSSSNTTKNINDDHQQPTTSAKALQEEYSKQNRIEELFNNTEIVQVKTEPITYEPQQQQQQHYQHTTGFSILEQHLSSKDPLAIMECKEEKPCILETTIKEMKIENNVNDDARVLYDFANSKKSSNNSNNLNVKTTKPTTGTTFPSSSSLFSNNNLKVAAAEHRSRSNLSTEISNNMDKKITSQDIDTASYSSQSAMDATMPSEEHTENSITTADHDNEHNPQTQAFTDFPFSYLYNNNSNNIAEQVDIKHHHQHHPHQQQFHTFYQNVNATTNNNNNNATMLLDDSSSSKNYGEYQQQPGTSQSHHQWFNSGNNNQNNYHTSDGGNIATAASISSNHSTSNLNSSLSVDGGGNAALVDGNEVGKYLDLDTCKREQNIDMIVVSRSGVGDDGDHVPAPPPPSSSTSCSFTGTTDNSMAGICSTAATLNIRTDEKMPAKGEISEQESNCDIDNSWSQPMYGDISARFFKTTFPGIFPQDNGWNHDDYFTVQDLSASTTAQASNANNRMKSFEFRLPLDANNTVGGGGNTNSSGGSGLQTFSQNSNDNCNIDVMPSTSAKIRKRRKRNSQDGKMAQSASASAKRMQPTSTITSQQQMILHHESGIQGVDFNFQQQSQPQEQQQDQQQQQSLLQQPTTSAAFLAGPSNASTAAATTSSSSSTSVMNQQQQIQQKQRTKVYECGHCNVKYSKLKDRNAHMVDAHNYIRQNRRLVCPTTGLATPLTNADMQDIVLPTTSAAGGSIVMPPLQNADCMVGADYKHGIVKIENENIQRDLVSGLEPPLNADLRAKTEVMEDDKQNLALVPISTGNLEFADTKPPTSLALSLTTPTSKLTTLYRMLVSFNMTTLKQNQSLSEFDENLIKSSIFFCYLCRQNFNSVKLYDAHLTEHPAECFTCGKKFQRWKNFSLHLKRHLGWKEFGCTVCDKKFVVRSALVEHMRMHSGLSPLKCKVCGKHFKRYSNLTQHRKRHTKQIIRRKEYVCYCGEVLPSKARFLWHKETHDSKPKCCPHCCDRFVHVNSLRRHIRLAHSDKFDYTEPMECPICKQIFAKASMKAHMATHSTETQYDCVICSKSFSTKWNLKIHSWVHANRTSKPFKCEHCPKAFVREVDFKNHMNSHKQIKPYTCEVCGCKFIRKYNYMRHRREHHGNKKYTCDLCKKSFHRHYYLIEHRRIHTGERPFQCTICGKSSTTKTNHNKHLKIHHSRDPFTVEV